MPGHWRLHVLREIVQFGMARRQLKPWIKLDGVYGVVLPFVKFWPTFS